MEHVACTQQLQQTKTTTTLSCKFCSYFRLLKLFKLFNLFKARLDKLWMHEDVMPKTHAPETGARQRDWNEVDGEN